MTHTIQNMPDTKPSAAQALTTDDYRIIASKLSLPKGIGSDLGIYYFPEMEGRKELVSDIIAGAKAICRDSTIAARAAMPVYASSDNGVLDENTKRQVQIAVIQLKCMQVPFSHIDKEINYSIKHNLDFFAPMFDVKALTNLSPTANPSLLAKSRDAMAYQASQLLTDSGLQISINAKLSDNNRGQQRAMLSPAVAPDGRFLLVAKSNAREEIEKLLGKDSITYAPESPSTDGKFIYLWIDAKSRLASDMVDKLRNNPPKFIQDYVQFHHIGNRHMSFPPKEIATICGTAFTTSIAENFGKALANDLKTTEHGQRRVVQVIIELLAAMPEDHARTLIRAAGQESKSRKSLFVYGTASSHKNIIRLLTESVPRELDNMAGDSAAKRVSDILRKST